MTITNYWTNQKHPLRFARLWLTIGWLLVFAVVVLSLWPRPQHLAGLKIGGILGHLVAYMTLMVWFTNIYPRRDQKIWLGAAFFAMGVFLECIQGLSGYRSFEFADMLTNGIGVFLGWCLVKTKPGGFLQHLDTKLFRLGEIFK